MTVPGRNLLIHHGVLNAFLPAHRGEEKRENAGNKSIKFLLKVNGQQQQKYRYEGSTGMILIWWREIIKKKRQPQMK